MSSPVCVRAQTGARGSKRERTKEESWEADRGVWSRETSRELFETSEGGSSEHEKPERSQQCCLNSSNSLTHVPFPAPPPLRKLIFWSSRCISAQLLVFNPSEQVNHAAQKSPCHTWPQLLLALSALPRLCSRVPGEQSLEAPQVLPGRLPYKMLPEEGVSIGWQWDITLFWVWLVDLPHPVGQVHCPGVGVRQARGTSQMDGKPDQEE